MKKNLHFFVVVVSAILLISLANPVLAHVFDVNITGTATMTSYGSYSQIYFYEYTLTFANNNTKDISHWSLELSDCCNNNDLISPSAPPGWSSTKPQFAEPALPGNPQICGIKWDAPNGVNSGTFTFSFYSLGKPETVNWYAKNGSGYIDQGTTTGPDCDDLIAVELTTFTAQATTGIVTLTWTTATETENLGFHLYRSVVEHGKYAQITKEMILGTGSSDKAHTYSYADHHVEAGKTYYYKLVDVDFNGNMTFHGPISVTVEAIPNKYALAQNYPNPFNPETAIGFALKEAGKVTLKIYNLQGQLVRTLVDEDKPAGSYSVMWNGTNERGIKLTSSVYYYTLKVNGFKETKKLLFMK